MLIVTVVAPVLATNCYLVGADDSTGCVVVDPGIGVADAVLGALHEHGRSPEAVVMTHGHVDHTFDTGRLQERFDIPAYIHEADRYRLDDPVGTTGPRFAGILDALHGSWRAAGRVITVTDRVSLQHAGVTLRTLAMPGHTEGSMFYVVDDPTPGAPARRTIFTGDVLFAGTIGRTDLPGGDDATMRRTLAVVADPRHPVLTADAVVLPGHGPASTIGAERATNPFLTAAGVQ